MGGYYWNSGIFIWRTERIIEELEKQMPKLMKKLRSFKKTKRKSIYTRLEPISVDYGVMEGAEDVIMIESGFDWDDLGTWNALARHLESDALGNVCVGRINIHDCKSSILYADEGIIAALGIDDMIVVRTKNAVLVCPRSRANEVKALIQNLRKEER